MSERELSNPASERTWFVARATAVAALWISAIVSPGLWFESSAASPLPLVDGLTLPDWLAWAWLFALGLTSLSVLLPRYSQRAALAFCLVFASRTLWDRIMWQPYLLQYGAFMCVFVFAAPKRQSALAHLRLILALIYLWSALGKFHMRYLTGAGGILGTETFAGVAPDTKQILGIATATWELLCAVGLWFPRTRRAAVVGLSAMHVGVLFVLGPLLLDKNIVVWPWNLANMIWVPLLFWNGQASLKQLAGGVRPVTALIALMFAIGPALVYVGFWNEALGYRLYSARAVDAQFFFTTETSRALPEHLQAQLRPWSYEQFTGYIPIPDLVEAEIYRVLH